MRNYKKYLCVGPGGTRCPCCFPPPGKARKALYRRAKKAEKKDSLRINGAIAGVLRHPNADQFD